ncbi:hypothetical protein FRX31_023988 [Thalictrum thalictroides]|uniref:Uncharacterized protein n=1 Tax=Thalictrum thalictroides TaxID=46969 RepID=A0A7J6VQE1_THATH|nr:hypothetical protein FRX31_023988 [Thalictrum thalictroides]
MASGNGANEDGFVSRSGKEDEDISDFNDGSNVEEIHNDEVEENKEELMKFLRKVKSVQLNLEKQKFILERNESIEVAAGCEGNQKFDVYNDTTKFARHNPLI